MFIRSLIIGACLGLTSQLAVAQNTVNLVVPFSPGGPTDQTTRLIGNELARLTGKTVVVENKPGAGGIIAAQYVAHAKPDGSVYMIGSPSSLVLNPGLYKNLPYDPEKDFVPVAGLTRSPLVLIVNNEVPADNVKEMIAFAKTQKDGLVMGSPGNGTIPHIAGSYFAQRAGIELLHVPYKGISPAVVALMSGEIQLLFDTLSTSTANIEAKKVKALGIASAYRFSGMPDLPTLDEQGYPLEASSWFGLVAPAGTPDDIVKAMNRDINAVLEQEEFRKKLVNMGSEPMLGDAADFARFIEKERKQWLPEIKRLNLTVD